MSDDQDTRPTKRNEADPKSSSDQAEGKKPKKNDTVRGMRAVGMSALAQESDRLQAAANQRRQADMTERFKFEDRTGVPEVSGLPFGADAGEARFYRKLPISLGATALPADTPRWRIELEGLGPGVEPLGLDIIGDAVIGRGRVSNQPADLDLDQFGGLEQGVSRRHALLRPTANHLYIIDLGSTNGTMHNGLPLGPGIARSLKNNDTLTLGRLSFTVNIIDGPGMRRPSPPPGVEADSEPTRPLTAETGGAAEPYVSPTKTDMPRITPDMIDAQRDKLDNKDDTGELPHDKPTA